MRRREEGGGGGGGGGEGRGGEGRGGEGRGGEGVRRREEGGGKGGREREGREGFLTCGKRYVPFPFSVSHHPTEHLSNHSQSPSLQQMHAKATFSSMLCTCMCCFVSVKS